MHKPNQYLVICRSCSGVQQVSEDALSATLNGSGCSECGSDHQPFLRRVEREGAIGALLQAAGLSITSLVSKSEAPRVPISH